MPRAADRRGAGALLMLACLGLADAVFVGPGVLVVGSRTVHADEQIWNSAADTTYNTLSIEAQADAWVLDCEKHMQDTIKCPQHGAACGHYMYI